MELAKLANLHFASLITSFRRRVPRVLIGFPAELIKAWPFTDIRSLIAGASDFDENESAGILPSASVTFTTVISRSKIKSLPEPNKRVITVGRNPSLGC